MRHFVPFLLLAGIVCSAQAPNPPVAAVPAKDLATVSGRTTGATGQPLRKSTVTLRPIPTGPMTIANQSPPYAATTDAEGKFSFEGVEPGRYMLSAEHAGYLRTNYGSKKGSMSSSLVTLTAGQSMKDLTIEMALQSTISGKALDEDGEPAAKLQIQLLRKYYGNGGKKTFLMAGNATSDENGDYKITSVAPGHYYLSASQQSQMFIDSARRAGANPNQDEEAAVTTYYPGVIDLSAATVIDVTVGQDIAGMNLKLRKAPVFHIRGKAAGAIPGDSQLRVVAMPEGGIGMMWMQKSTSLGKDGSFDLTGIPAGSYSVGLMKLQGMLQVLDAVPVQVGTRSLEDIVITVRPSVDLTGAVKTEGEEKKPPAKDSAKANKNPANDTAPRFALTLLSLDGPSINTPNVTSKSDGTFTFTSVSPGKYRVSVFGPDGYLKSVKLGGVETIETGIDLTQGAPGPLEVTMSLSGGAVSGTVKNAEGQPAASVTVTLVPDSATIRPDMPRTASTDKDGRFSLVSAVPGKYRLYAWEELELGAQSDPDFIRLHSHRGIPLTVEENGSRDVELKVITVADVESDAKTGR